MRLDAKVLTALGITPGVNPDNLRHFFEEVHRLTK